MMKDNMMRIGFIDDNAIALPIISGAVKSFLDARNIGYSIKEYTSSENLFSENLDFDVLFCDIEMPDKDGIQIAKEYKENHPEASIIFVSNREDRVFDSMDVHPFGFIRKKNFIDDIERVFSLYLDHMNKEEKEDRFMVFESGSEITRVILKNIIYIESKQRYQYIHMSDGEEIRITQTMNKIDEQLSDKGFIFCHKSFIVNYRYIKVIEQDTILLRNGERIYMSRRKSPQVKELYLSMIAGEKKIVM